MICCYVILYHFVFGLCVHDEMNAKLMTGFLKRFSFASQIILLKFAADAEEKPIPLQI